MTPQIGVPRLYHGDIAVLYPGERATAVVEARDIAEAVALAKRLGDLYLTLQPGDWIVEPEPGAAAAWRRLRYRLVDQWLDRLGWRIGRRRPMLVTSIHVNETKEREL